MQYFGLRVLLKRFTAIKFMMADKAVPKRKKALILFGIFYILCPIDIIPLPIFPVAWLDDVLLWIFILWYLRKELDRYWMGEKPKDYSQKFRGKTVVDDVEYSVDEENDQN